jgi:futalosine hydrolase
VILVVAATERELAGAGGASVLACGIGPVEAAAATARALAHDPPRALLHVGLAGARSVPVGALVLGSEAVYCDLAAAIPVVSRVRADERLVSAARRALIDAPVLPIGTSAAVGSVAHDVRVEAMEGFGVLRACSLAGVPAVEVRAISNEIGEGDRSRWDVGGAVAAVHRVLPALLGELAQV